MRDPNRIPEFLAELERVWSAQPDLRFGQLVVNLFGDDPFYIEDEDAMTKLRNYKKVLRWKMVDKTTGEILMESKE